MSKDASSIHESFITDFVVFLSHAIAVYTRCCETGALTGITGIKLMSQAGKST